MQIKEVNQLLLQMRKVEVELTKQFEQAVGFSLTRYQILLYLQDAPYSLQTEIAQHVHIDPAAMTRHLRALEEQGYVTRERNLQNAREIQVVLTDFARNTLEACQAEQGDTETVPLTIQDEPLRQLAAVLADIVKSLQD